MAAAMATGGLKTQMIQSQLEDVRAKRAQVDSSIRGTPSKLSYDRLRDLHQQNVIEARSRNEALLHDVMAAAQRCRDVAHASTATAKTLRAAEQAYAEHASAALRTSSAWELHLALYLKLQAARAQLTEEAEQWRQLTTAGSYVGAGSLTRSGTTAAASAAPMHLPSLLGDKLTEMAVRRAVAANAAIAQLATIATSVPAAASPVKQATPVPVPVAAAQRPPLQQQQQQQRASPLPLPAAAAVGSPVSDASISSSVDLSRGITMALRALPTLSSSPGGGQAYVLTPASRSPLSLTVTSASIEPAAAPPATFQSAIAAAAEAGSIASALAAAQQQQQQDALQAAAAGQNVGAVTHTDQHQDQLYDLSFADDLLADMRELEAVASKPPAMASPLRNVLTHVTVPGRGSATSSGGGDALEAAAVAGDSPVARPLEHREAAAVAAAEAGGAGDASGGVMAAGPTVHLVGTGQRYPSPLVSSVASTSVADAKSQATADDAVGSHSSSLDSPDRVRSLVSRSAPAAPVASMAPAVQLSHRLTSSNSYSYSSDSDDEQAAAAAAAEQPPSSTTPATATATAAAGAAAAAADSAAPKALAASTAGAHDPRTFPTSSSSSDSSDSDASDDGGRASQASDCSAKASATIGAFHSLPAVLPAKKPVGGGMVLSSLTFDLEGTKKKAEPLVKSAPSLHTAGSGPSAKPAAHKPPLASQSPPGSLPTKLNLQSVLPPPPAGGGRSPIAGSSAGSTVVSKVLAGGLSEFADDEDDDSDDLDRDLRAGRVGGATPRSASAPPLGVSRSSRMAAMDDDDDDDF